MAWLNGSVIPYASFSAPGHEGLETFSATIEGSLHLYCFTPKLPSSTPVTRTPSHLIQVQRQSKGRL
jgi:hypothetical protein